MTEYSSLPSNLQLLGENLEARPLRSSGFYQLKGNLIDVELERGSTKLVLIFEKRSDPEYSAERIRALKGFVVCSIKRVRDQGPTLQAMP